ncbi:hypothetical protein [Streptomyces sp. DSM 40750]|nr:hypothetical protein [Streptomyces sp. DSM 40750]UUU21262.1 hypothetical protein JIX55_13620 [Streptomyces sp. DSM 40750]
MGGDMKALTEAIGARRVRTGAVVSKTSGHRPPFALLGGEFRV